MDTKRLKVMILSSRVNEPRKARKAEEIFNWEITILKKMRKKMYI